MKNVIYGLEVIPDPVTSEDEGEPNSWFDLCDPRTGLYVGLIHFRPNGVVAATVLGEGAEVGRQHYHTRDGVVTEEERSIRISECCRAVQIERLRFHP